MKLSFSLIGMPGSGKTTVGRALAKHLNYAFVDADDLIRERIQMSLQDYLDRHSEKALVEIESEILRSVAAQPRQVISTGGSAVYSDAAMQWLKSFSIVIYLSASLEKLKSRMSNVESRGIVGLAAKGLGDVWSERLPLYEKYADMTVSTEEFDKSAIVDTIRRSLDEYN